MNDGEFYCVLANGNEVIEEYDDYSTAEERAKQIFSRASTWVVSIYFGIAKGTQNEEFTQQLLTLKKQEPAHLKLVI